MGKGKRNHKNKKSKPNKPTIASAAGHSEELVIIPQEPPSHPDSSMASTENNPPSDSAGTSAPAENKLLDTHQLPAEKGIPKAEESDMSKRIEGENQDGNLNEKAHKNIEDEQIGDTTVEAIPIARTSGSGVSDPIEQDQQDEEGYPEKTAVSETKEENQESPTKGSTPETTPSAHKKRHSRPGTSVETQVLKHNHLHAEDIGPQHIQADRETRELRHIDLEGGEIGYNPGNGDNHDRGSEHHAPAEPKFDSSTTDTHTSIESLLNEALAEERVTRAHITQEPPLDDSTQKLTEVPPTEKEVAKTMEDTPRSQASDLGEEAQEEGKEGAREREGKEEKYQGVEEEQNEEDEQKEEGKVKVATYAQVAANEPSDVEQAQEQVTNEEKRNSVEEARPEIIKEKSPETGKPKGINSNREVIPAEEFPNLGVPVEEQRGADKESDLTANRVGAMQTPSSSEVPSSGEASEAAIPEAGELKDINVEDDIGGEESDNHHHGPQQHTPGAGSPNASKTLEAASGANTSVQNSGDGQKSVEGAPVEPMIEKTSSENNELRAIDGAFECIPGKEGEDDRSLEHQASKGDLVSRNSEDESKVTTEGTLGETQSEEVTPETQELRGISRQVELGYNPGKGDTHDHWTKPSVSAVESPAEAAANKVAETEGGSMHNQAAEEMEEAFEELLMEDSAHEQELREGDTTVGDKPGETVDEELVFENSAEVAGVDGVDRGVELVEESKSHQTAMQAGKQRGLSNTLEDPPAAETKGHSVERGLPHIDITNDQVPDNSYTEDASDGIKRQSEESAKAVRLPNQIQSEEIEQGESLENLANHALLGIDSLATELGKSYHIPMSNDPSSRGDTDDTPLTYQEDFFSERLSDLAGDHEVLEYECSIKIGSSGREPGTINGKSVTIDQLQETISCFKKEVLESLESRNLLANTEDTQQNQDQTLILDISQLGPRLGKMESDLDFIRKQISSINTNSSNGPSLLPQYSSKDNRASRSTSPHSPSTGRRVSWSMISLGVVTALGLVALGSMLGPITKERGLTDKVAQWLFSEGKAVGKS